MCSPYLFNYGNFQTPPREFTSELSSYVMLILINLIVIIPMIVS